MNRLALLLLLLVSTIAHSQIDRAKADSLARSIAAKQKNVAAFQDSFIKNQESTYHAEVAKGLQQHSNHDTSLSAEEKNEERNSDRQVYVRLGLTALLLVLLVIGLLRIRNKSKQS